MFVTICDIVCDNCNLRFYHLYVDNGLSWYAYEIYLEWISRDMDVRPTNLSYVSGSLLILLI